MGGESVLRAGFDEWLSYLFLALTLFKFVMLIDAAVRREDAYRAANKQKKSFWLLLLGGAVLLDFVPIGGLHMIITIAGLIAAIVYCVDVRPAVREVIRNSRANQRRRGR